MGWGWAGAGWNLIFEEFGWVGLGLKLTVYGARLGLDWAGLGWAGKGVGEFCAWKLNLVFVTGTWFWAVGLEIEGLEPRFLFISFLRVEGLGVGFGI